MTCRKGTRKAHPKTFRATYWGIMDEVRIVLERSTIVDEVTVWRQRPDGAYEALETFLKGAKIKPLRCPFCDSKPLVQPASGRFRFVFGCSNRKCFVNPCSGVGKLESETHMSDRDRATLRWNIRPHTHEPLITTQEAKLLHFHRFD